MARCSHGTDGVPLAVAQLVAAAMELGGPAAMDGAWTREAGSISSGNLSSSPGKRPKLATAAARWQRPGASSSARRLHKAAAASRRHGCEDKAGRQWLGAGNFRCMHACGGPVGIAESNGMEGERGEAAST